MRILAVDQAEHSGWCMIVPTPSALAPARIQRAPHLSIVHWGLASNALEREHAIRTALAQSPDRDELYVVLEDHSDIPLVAKTRFDRGRGRGHKPTITTATVLGMGDARGRWREQLELAGLAKSHVRMVTPEVWRGHVLGRRMAKARKEIAKPAALTVAQSIVKQPLETDDVAEAICIGLWAAEHLEYLINTERAEARQKRAERAAKGAA